MNHPAGHGLQQGRAWRSLLPLLLAALMLALSAPLARAQAGLPDLPYLVVDQQSGSVLLQNRVFERWHPASLTKLMTAYAVFRAIEQGEISDGSPVFITANATRTPPSRMGYATDTQLRFDTALRLLIVKSANDVAVAVAESLDGTVDQFVARMNLESERLGLADTRFANPHGLHDPGQYTSARDMAVLASAVWREFPRWRELFETPTLRTGEQLHTSYNLLLERFAGATGMKTGFVCASGYNIVASAERDNRRLVAVVLGTNSQTERAELAARLLLAGFDGAGGSPLSSLDRPQAPTGPADLRNVMCSEAARANRYDPASETAVIESPFLEPRRVTREPVDIRTGGIDGEPSSGWMARAFMPSRIPLPVRRPDYAVVGVDGDVLGSDSLLRGTIPVPAPSPRALQ